ncbi:MAG TPA: acyltransferase [Gemmatimonadales bacterium]
MDAPELLHALRQLHAERSAAVREEWNRSLPLADYVVDRWQRARDLGFGEGASIYDSSLVFGDVRVGAGTWVGPFTVLDGTGGLTIGRTCSISAGVQIYTHDSVRWALSGGVAEYERRPVEIGDHCYIGPMTLVAMGVTIGRHCLIGANSIVNKDLPDNSIAFGSTCRIVGRVVVGSDGSVALEYDT